MPKIYSNLKLNSLRQTPRKSAMAIDIDGFVVKGDVFDTRKLSKMSIFDKGLSANNTSGDGQSATNSTLSEEPLDSSYIDVRVNGISYEVGNATKTKVCYFSGDGGSTAKSFDSSHTNGKVSKGDSLYWNGTVAGFNLTSTWNISIHYLRNDYDQLEAEIRALETDIQALQTEITNMQDEIVKVQSDYDNAIAVGDTTLASKLQDEIDEITAKLQDFLDTQSAMQLDLIDKQNELDFGINYYQLIADAQLLKLNKETEIISLQQAEDLAISTYNTEASQLQNNIDSLTASITQLEDTINSTQADIAQKTSELAAANQAGDTVLADSLTNEINALQQLLDDSNVSLKTNVSELNSTVTQLDELNFIRAEDEDVYNSNISILQKEIADLDAQIAEYQSNL